LDGIVGGDNVIIQLKESKTVISLVFYATENKQADAKKVIEEIKPILQKHGFPVEDVVESRTKRPE